MKYLLSVSLKAFTLIFLLLCSINVQGAGLDIYSTGPIAAGTYDYITVHSGTATINGAAVTVTAGGVPQITVKEGASMMITNSSVIDGYFYVVINPGGKLTVQNNSVLKMAVASRIDVQSSYNTGSLVRGGIFIMKNGAKLTPAGGWNGVYVWGGSEGNTLPDTVRHFSHQTNLPARALLENSTIEGAVSALNNYNYGDNAPLWASAGGIIQISSCIIRNNRNGVVFKKYNNFQAAYHPLDIPWNFSNIKNDASYIRNTNFAIEFVTPYPPGTFSCFIRATQINGLNIVGCKFTSDGFYEDEYSRGIDLIKATATIDKACNDPWINMNTPCTSVGPSSFKGVSNPIHATGGGLTGKLSIMNIDFQCYGNAVVVDGYSGTKIVDNDILLLGPGAGFSPNKAAGIIVQGGMAHRIWDNHVTRSSSGYLGYGIVLNNAASTHELVYRNTIDNTGGGADLDFSMQANGVNHNPSAFFSGLEYQCNDMHTNASISSYDIHVTGVGIAAIQGGPSLPAHNQFSPKTSPVLTGLNFYNPTANVAVNYFYKPDTYTYPAEVNNVSRFSIVATNYCNLALFDGYLPYNTYAGKLTGIKNDIRLVTPGVDLNSDGLVAYDELLKDYERVQDSLIHGLIYGSDSTDTYPLDSVALSGSDSLLFTPSGARISTDSIGTVLDSSEFVYQHKIWRAGIYAQQMDFAAALAELDAIAGNYSIDSTDSVQIAEIRLLVVAEEYIYENEAAWGEIGTEDDIISIAENSYGYGRYWARLLLHEYAGIVLDPDLMELPGERPAGNTAPAPMAKNRLLKLSPNPTSDMVSMETGQKEENSMIRVTDVTGRKLQELKLPANGKLSISLKELKAGVYFVHLLRNGKTVETNKVIKN